MITPDQVKQIALAFPATDLAPHGKVIGFRVKKKIFITLNILEDRACLRFNQEDQHAFCAFAGSPFYPVPNKWGKLGWTLVNLATADLEMITDAITTAYCTVAPPKLAEPFQWNGDDFG